MADRQILAIVGATGAQGGGLARAALEDSERRFEVRALTRNADSDKARALAAQGAEVVVADLDDLASLEAAASPADTPYLYFVSRNDGSHVFAATLAEHNRAVARLRQAGR